MEFRYDDPFMNTGDRTISEMGRFARQYVHSDPTSCIVKQGMIIEYIVTTFLREAGYCSDSGWDMGISEKLQILKDEGYWNMDLYHIANHRNKAVHQSCLQKNDETIGGNLSMVWSLPFRIRFFRKRRRNIQERRATRGSMEFQSFV